MNHKFLAGRKLMHSIKINYIADENVNQHRLEKIFNDLYLKNYLLKIDVYDFSLVKNINKYIETLNNKNIRVFEFGYEEHKDAQNVILKNIDKDSLVFTSIKTNIVIDTKFIDELDFEKLNENYGFVYSDYSIREVRCYMQSHKTGGIINTPMIFWNTKKIMENKNESNVFNHVYGTSMGKHIPKISCKIIYD
jgi:hypothetical protein